MSAFIASVEDIKYLQQRLNELGLYPDNMIDGKLGDFSRKGLTEALDMLAEYKNGSTGNMVQTVVPPLTSGLPQMIWGAKVDDAFKREVVRTVSLWTNWTLSLEEACNWFMSASGFETQYTFSPSKKNNAGSSGTGLIQFMEAQAKAYGTSTAALAKMTAVEQFEYVRKHYAPYNKRIRVPADVYMAILWPAAIGKGDDYAIITHSGEGDGGLRYMQNKGLDLNKDGRITVYEAMFHIRASYKSGSMNIG